MSKSRWFVAGHNGLVGSAFMRRLRCMGVADVLVRNRAEMDLRDSGAVTQFFAETRPDYVVLAAGRVGGIVENQKHPADFIRDNLSIQLNVLQAAHNAGVKKLILFGSSCMYPRECSQPMTEESLLSGKLELTSLPYAISKLAGVHMCLAYNKQFSEKRFIPVIPNSVYGPNDNFNLETGHVLSALIRRFYEAKINHAHEVTLWGSGNPRREFIHAYDVVDACLHLLKTDIDEVELPINIGVGVDYSILELAEIIANITGYRGKISWDSNKPDGAPRKLLDSRRLLATGWQSGINFIDGVQGAYEWYLQQLPLSDSDT
ncbi:GDP-L-fucose synthase [Alphaproteobacteria bacterium]|nr:GDP-L-fucose synthase [Alphaproteobacteria bacterium]